MGPDEFLAGEEEEILPSPTLLLRKGLGAEFSVKKLIVGGGWPEDFFSHPKFYFTPPLSLTR